MKVLVFLSVFSFSAMSFASPSQSFAEAVEEDLNDFFSETINEGESYAEVLRVKGKPQVKCSPVIQKGSKRLVFCSAQIKTEYLSGGEEQIGGTDCTSLGFRLNRKNQIEDRYNSESFQACLEKVYDASYD